MTLQGDVLDKEGTPPGEPVPYVVNAESPVYGGYVIARHEKVIFLKGAIPGEIVEVSVEERKKDYLLASVKNIIEPSPFRRTAPCKVFGICGGCQLQFISYEKQVSMKEEILLDALRRIGDISIDLSPSMVNGEFKYRHRAQFKVSKQGDIGFYKEGTRDVVPIQECPLMIDEINDALKKMRGRDMRGIRELHVASGDAVTVLIKGSAGDDLAQELLDMGISGVAFENGDSVGRDYITLPMEGLKYSVTPWSFFQTNWSLNKTMTEIVKERLGTLEGKKILDLYAGAGNFSLPLAGGAREVTAVEENPYAVEDGRRNVTLNGIGNCTFVHLTVEKCFETGRKQRTARLFGEANYDIVILDPPRAGLSSDFSRKILDISPEKVVYISCNPATLARDLRRMKDKYDLEAAYMGDFFPNTYHIESVNFLIRR
jgi:23S rRNA (uracil1939-C5)-methyltransferase